MADTLAVVVTYNRCVLLRECIDNLLSQRVACDILAIDNCSTDNTADVLSSYSEKNVKYMRTKKNIGGAGGFNLGMRYAVEHSYKYVWIMDDDCIATDSALEQLLKLNDALGGDYGFLSSLVLWTDGNVCRMNRQKVVRNIEEKLNLLQYGAVPIYQATFVSAFFRIDTIKRVGLPIKEFFIWGDDTEYTRRISKKYKIPCYLAGHSVVIHKTKNNCGSNLALAEVNKIPQYKYAYRNEHYLYRHEGLKGFCIYNLRCMYHILRILVKARDHRLKRIGVIVGQWFAGWFFRPKIEYIDD